MQAKQLAFQLNNLLIFNAIFLSKECCADFPTLRGGEDLFFEAASLVGPGVKNFRERGGWSARARRKEERISPPFAVAGESL
jgi:hypothetical protein